jgi:hypothetical protein
MESKFSEKKLKKIAKEIDPFPKLSKKKATYNMNVLSGEYSNKNK